MSLKKIIASAGIAAGAFAAMAGTASASALPVPQLPQVDPIEKISELGQGAGVSTLHNMGGNVEMIHDGTDVIGG